MPEAATAIPKSDVERKLENTGSSKYDLGGKGYLSEIEKVAMKYDVDGDGQFSLAEVEKIVDDMSTAKKSAAKAWHIVTFVMVLYLLTLGVFTGLVFAANEASKETHATNDVLVSKSTGHTMQVANNAFKAAGGALVDRKTLKPVETSNPKKSHALTSRVPDRYLSELSGFSVNLDGIEQYITVKSFKRVPEEKANCGSVVVLSTDKGDFTLDDTHLYHADGVLEITGEFDVDDDGDTARRLSAHHGRRLTSKAEGLFNFIDEAEFVCKVEWKGKTEEKKLVAPIPPYSYVIKEVRNCITTDDGVTSNRCISTFGATSYKPRPGATLNATTMTVLQRVLVTKDNTTISVEYLPNHPTQADVTVETPLATGAIRTYTYQMAAVPAADTAEKPWVGKKLYCEEKVSANESFDLSNGNVYMSYLGIATENDKRYRRFSVQPKDKDLADYMAFEMWDREDDHTLAKLLPPKKQLLGEAPLYTTYHEHRNKMSSTDVAKWFEDYLPVENPLVDDASCNVTTKSIDMPAGKKKMPIMSGPFQEIDPSVYAQNIDDATRDAFGTKEMHSTSYGAYWSLLESHYELKGSSTPVSTSRNLLENLLEESPHRQLKSRKKKKTTTKRKGVNCENCNYEDDCFSLIGEFDPLKKKVPKLGKLELAAGLCAEGSANSFADVKAMGNNAYLFASAKIHAEATPISSTKGIYSWMLTPYATGHAQGKFGPNVQWASGKITLGLDAKACAGPKGVVGSFQGNIEGSIEVEAETGKGVTITGEITARARLEIRTRKDGRAHKCKCSRNGGDPVDAIAKQCTKSMGSVAVNGRLTAKITDIKEGGKPKITIDGELRARLNLCGFKADFRTAHTILKDQKMGFKL